jgi:hypothetical protein
VLSPTFGQGSFLVSVDDGEEVVYDVSGEKRSIEWGWIEVNERMGQAIKAKAATFQFPGEHGLSFGAGINTGPTV